MTENEKPEYLEWMPLYWLKFLVAVRAWKAQEVGAYLLLLIHQWDKGFIPENETEIEEIATVSFQKLSKVMRKFEKVGNKFFNKQLEIIRSEQLEKNATNSIRGKKGAEERWRIHREKIAQEMLEHNLTNGKRREESRTEQNRTDEREKDSHDNGISFDLKKLSLVMQSEVSWLESICRKYKCEFNFARDKILDFIVHLETQAIESKTLKDAKSHFDNWFRIQKSNDAGNNKNGKSKQFDRAKLEEGLLKYFPPKQPRNDSDTGV